MTTRQIKGRICSGKKESARYIKLSWVRKQIEEKLGFAPFSGTLNIRLDDKNAAKLKEILKETSATEIVPEKGFCRAQCYKVSLMDDVECAIVIPIIEDYPANMIELVAKNNLKAKLGLKDDDTVRLRIP